MLVLLLELLSLFVSVSVAVSLFASVSDYVVGDYLLVVAVAC